MSEVRKAIRGSKRTALGHRPARTLLTRSRSSIKADVKDENGTNIRELLLSLDYGTSTLSAAFRFAEPDEEPSPNTIHDVHFSEREYLAPQLAAWGDDGTFYWGYGISRALKRHLISQEDVLELWKLLLYNDHELSGLAQQVDTQLGDRSLEDLLSTHFEHVIKEAKSQIKSIQTHEFSSEDVDSIPTQVLLSVPQMWKAPANRIITQAAKAAGIAYVELVYEPQCAAAYFTYHIKDRLPKQLEIGDILLVADVGGGTGDFVSYELRSSSDSGAKVALQSIRKPKGALCGSEFVNQHFLSWLKKHPDGFTDQCKRLKLTETACLKQASRQFESIKCLFSGPDDGGDCITIRGAKRSGATRPTWDVEVPSEDIVTFFAPVFAKIDECIDAQLMPRTKIGISRAEVEQAANPRSTSAVGAYQPVSRGALLRYKDVSARGFPAEDSFGIAMVETYKKRIHGDATHSPNEDSSKRGKKRKRSFVEKDPYDKSPIVFERWNPILRRGTVREPGKAFTTETWQEYLVEEGQTTIEVQIYWTERDDLKDHAAIRTGKGGLTPLLEGIEEWGNRLVMELPDLSALGYDLRESRSKGECYDIRVRLLLERDGANIKVKWQIAPPDADPFDGNGVARDSHGKLSDSDGEVFEICDAAFNPSVRVSPT